MGHKFHIPVLLEEILSGLNCREAPGLYLDCTLGDGGHAKAILDAHPQNKVLGMDQDPQSLERAGQRLARYGQRVQFAEGNFRDLAEIAAPYKLEEIKGILLDVGFSSFQIDNPLRGFAFQTDAPLDMRMSPKIKFSAADIVNELSADELKTIFSDYGEERYSGRIASAIVKSRAKSSITSTQQLVAVVASAVPASYRHNRQLHFATRTFQALRIAVNDELSALEQALPAAVELLCPKGRLAVIAFHSLEDRIVKGFFKQMSAECQCPPQMPICICNTKPQLRIITRKPIIAAEDEILANPRSRSAKLRLAEKL